MLSVGIISALRFRPIIAHVERYSVLRNVKKVFALALAIVMIFSAIPVTVSAAESVTTITTVAELVAVANDLSGNYRLEKDIDLSKYGDWTPIGGSTAFSGTFEGNNKKITGLTVNTSSQYGGLFGNVSGTVKNLYVKGTVTVNSTSSSAYAGLVAGNVGLFGTVDSCSAEGNVTVKLNHSSSSFIAPKGNAYAGGVIGNSSSFYEFSELSQIAKDNGVLLICKKMKRQKFVSM